MGGCRLSWDRLSTHCVQGFPLELLLTRPWNSLNNNCKIKYELHIFGFRIQVHLISVPKCHMNKPYFQVFPDYHGNQTKECVCYSAELGYPRSLTTHFWCFLIVFLVYCCFYLVFSVKNIILSEFRPKL